MSIANSTWQDWTGRPARYKGTPGNHHTRVVAPEWAYCTVERFEELRLEAWFLRVTLSEMQGDWDYPVKEEGIENDETGNITF